MWPVTRGEPEREEEEQEREPPIPLLWLQRLADDWTDWLLSEELLREGLQGLVAERGLQGRVAKRQTQRRGAERAGQGVAAQTGLDVGIAE